MGGRRSSRVSLGPDEVLAELVAGNRRFTDGEPRYGHYISSAAAVADGQHPSAVVIGCIDSRVPLEAIFDQDFGAICVVRTGGQVLDRAVLGSVEFAVTALRVPMVMVLGHKGCGAIAATIATLRAGRQPAGPLGYLVDEITPAVREVGGDLPLPAVTSAHIRRTVATLRRLESLQAEIAAGTLGLVGAVYDLDTGRVEVLDQPT